MTPRTDDDRREIAKKCLEVEKRGGDVLALLRNEYHYISARATWVRMQKEFLKRKGDQIKSGHPEEVKRPAPRHSDEEAAGIILEAMGKGEDPYQVLSTMGYEKPDIRIWAARRWAKENDPEAYQIMEGLRRPKGKRKKQEAKKGEEMKEDEKKPESEDEGTMAGEKKELQLEPGVDYMMKIEEEKEAESRIRKPLTHSGMEACAWRGELGEFHYYQKRGFIHFRGAMGNEVSFTLTEWKEFQRELKTAAELMGVELDG